MKWGAIFQLSALFFLAQQALITPKILGMSNFGLQIVLLSPIFLAQSLFEPILQVHLNRQTILDSGKVYVSIQLLIVALFFSVAIVFATEQLMASSLTSLALIFLIIYLAQTLFISAAFRQGNIKASALAMAIIATTFTPLLWFFFSFWPDFALVSTLTTTFLLSSVFLAFKMEILSQIAFISRKPEPGEIIRALLFRVPLISISTLTIVLLGVLSVPGDEIGRVRILISLGGAVRFLNAIPLPRLQVLFSETKSTGFKRSAPELKAYARSFVLATISISVLGPISLSWYYAPNSFSFFEVVLFCTISLLQPAGYLAVLVNEANPVRQLLFILSGTSVSLLAFILLLAVGAPATYATGISSLLCLTSLILILFQQRKTRGKKKAA